MKFLKAALVLVFMTAIAQPAAAESIFSFGKKKEEAPKEKVIGKKGAASAGADVDPAVVAREEKIRADNEARRMEMQKRMEAQRAEQAAQRKQMEESREDKQ